MNVLIAPDKFKGTLTAEEVCDAVTRGLQRGGLKATVQQFPLADGGEGTLEVFRYHAGGALVAVEVHDPLMRLITAHYAVSEDGDTAFIEMARASGLQLLLPEERNPLKTTSFGTGELIRDALNRGVKKMIIGIGGTATNDASLGTFVALGGRTLDAHGNELFPRGENLELIHDLDFSLLHPALANVEITAICDVSNPFYGKDGAAFVYAPQKGATDEMVQALDRGLQQVARVIRSSRSIDLQDVTGSGAGGGFAGGVYALMHAALKPGIDVVMEMVQLDKALSHADVIITGEGKIDQQTLQGKVVAGVASQARQVKKPVIAVCGVCQLSENQWRTLPADYVFSLVDFAGEHQAMNNAAESLEQLVAAKLIPVLKQKG
ncbi:MAG: glycerate kinase [Cyclobacteriaceae bacterium]|jgi:glycerate kinase|nr:glycerate kinase [Cyclobacteriaceae bacterium]